ncbi:MAG: phage DNA encapsidation protein [Methanobrevibacter sp.]|nr:phage DNA encapsidation protein [Methanobrevibacter sp.]
MNIDKSMFWNLRRTLTHNMLINVIVGNRGGGKSYGAKEYAIDNFIKRGEQFGYIRRYKDDIKESSIQFFKDIEHQYPDYEFKVDGKYFYIRLKPADENEKWTDEDIAGYQFILSTANNKKSISYPKITLLIYDEFLLDKSGNQRYLNNEPIALLNLYETIARPGTDHPRVVMFMLANALSITNPFFLYWDLKMPEKQDKNGKWIWKHPTRPILVEDVRNEKFIDTKRNTEFGRLIEGTTYSNYSIDNKFLLDNDTFVEKKSPKARFYFTFVYKDNKFGVWADFTAGMLYVSKQIDPSYPLIYSITMKDHKPNMMFLKNKNKSNHFKVFLEAYQMGTLRFESINIKNICYEVIKLALSC